MRLFHSLATLTLGALVSASAAFSAPSETAQAPTPVLNSIPDGTTVAGEQLDPALFGPSEVVDLSALVSMDASSASSAQALTAVPRAGSPAPIPTASSATGSSGGSGGSSSILPPSVPSQIQNFQGPQNGDPGASSIPPDTHGAVGPTHFVAVTNTNLSVYVKTTGTRVVNQSLTTFFGANIGDPRVVFDPQSQRFFIIASDFTSRIYLAVSASNNPTGVWFKTNIIVAAGTDAGKWPDYPTLGVDQNGVYTASYMVGGANGMSIFAIDKAPLVAAVQSLGTVTAFRNLPWEGAMQPCVTWGTPAGAFIVSDPSAGAGSSSSLRVRRVNPPLTAPTLTTVATPAVTAHGQPPAVPQLGSVEVFDSIDLRPMQAMFINNSIWTTQNINVGGRAAVRWYQINTSPGVSITQSGNLTDATLHLWMGTIAANSTGDVLIGCSGSSAAQFAGCFVAGRAAVDGLGQISTPVQYKAGLAAYAPFPSDATQRWGDYSATTIDPNDGTLWTIQEYARTGNNWGTWIGHYGSPCSGTPDCNSNGVLDSCDITNGTSLDLNGDAVPDECQGLNAIVNCKGDGTDPLMVAFCPCLNTGAPGHGCANSVNADGALLSMVGLTNPDSLAFVVSGTPATASVIWVKGTGYNAAATVFGDGLRCVAGAQVRFGSTFASAGNSFYPDLGDPSISFASGVVPGSGTTAFYQAFYRNADPTFCTAGTVNMTNGFRIIW